MKLRFLALLLAFSALPIAAQVSGGGLYLNPVVMRISNSTPDTGLFAFLGQNATSNMFYGISLGGYGDFKVSPKMALGFDVREMAVHGNNAALDSLLFGVRLVGKPFQMPLKLYVQPSFGLGRSKSPYSPAHHSALQVNLFAGADYKLQKYLDWRVLEVGYGSVATVNSTNFGNVANIPASHLFSLTTGLVFRLP